MADKARKMVREKPIAIYYLCLFSSYFSIQFSSVQLLSRVWLFVTPWTVARQASLSITIIPELTQTHVPQVGDAIQPLIPCLPLFLLPYFYPFKNLNLSSYLILFFFFLYLTVKNLSLKQSFCLIVRLLMCFNQVSLICDFLSHCNEIVLISL